MAASVPFIEWGRYKRLRLSLRAMIAIVFTAALVAAACRKIGPEAWILGPTTSAYLLLGVALVRFAMTDTTRGWTIVLTLGITMLTFAIVAIAVLIVLPDKSRISTNNAPSPPAALVEVLP